MDEQRARAKADAKARKTGHGDLGAYRAVLDDAGDTEFLGYTDLASESRIVGLVVDGVGVPAAGAGTAVEVVLDRTPVLRRGRRPAGRRRRDPRRRRSPWRVDDVQSPGHRPGRAPRHGVTEGEATVDAVVSAEVDTGRRGAVSRSHSATHLVHAGMRKHLGDAAAQAGSLNAPGRLRFDFTSPAGAVPGSRAGRGRGRGQRRAAGRRGGARRSSPPRTRRAASARWRCSGRSTATRSASWRSATTPASCAAARTCTAPGSSAWSSCSRRARSAPGCAGSRRWSGSTRSATSPASTCWSPSSPSSSRRGPRSCPSGSAAWSSGCGRPSGSWRRSARTRCCRRRGRWPTGPRTSAGSRWSPPRCRTG